MKAWMEGRGGLVLVSLLVIATTIPTIPLADWRWAALGALFAGIGIAAYGTVRNR